MFHGARPWNRPRRALAEDDHAEHFVLGDVRHARRADDAPVLHHANPIRQIKDVVNVVADQEDADAVGLELSDEFADLRRLLRSERRRRLVHDQNAGVEQDRARDRHRLALAAGQRFDRLLEALEVRIEPAHDLARLGLHGDIVERAPACAQLAAEEQIGGGVDIVGERERLVDRLDAVFLGVARIGDDRLLAANA